MSEGLFYDPRSEPPSEWKKLEWQLDDLGSKMDSANTYLKEIVFLLEAIMKATTEKKGWW